jgi:short-subunit dehydrogenase
MTALVTGASAGLGATFARKLAARGYNLILVARRADRLGALAAELPVKSSIIAADLTTEAGLNSTESAIRACSSLELLVNNAGFGTKGRFWETEFTAQENMYRLHVLATMRLTRAALEGMTARAKGAVINVSSVAAFGNSQGNVSYCSTKAWMNSFSEGLEIELRGIESPVHVQALCPGFTVTEFHETLGVDRKLIPGWLWMTADAVVETSLQALSLQEKSRRKVIFVPGLQYKAAVALMRHLPWWLRRRAGRPGKDSRV